MKVQSTGRKCVTRGGDGLAAARKTLGAADPTG